MFPLEYNSRLQITQALFTLILIFCCLMENVKQVKYNLHYVSMHMFFIRNDQATQFTEDSKSVLLCLYFVLVVLSTSTVVTRT